MNEKRLSKKNLIQSHYIMTVRLLGTFYNANHNCSKQVGHSFCRLLVNYWHKKLEFRIADTNSIYKALKM